MGIIHVAVHPAHMLKALQSRLVAVTAWLRESGLLEYPFPPRYRRSLLVRFRRSLVSRTRLYRNPRGRDFLKRRRRNHAHKQNS